MDLKSSRSSRQNRIRKSPEGRNPFVIFLIIVALMSGAVAAGYFLSQVFLPMMINITPAQPVRSYSTISSAVISSSSNPFSSSASSAGTEESVEIDNESYSEESLVSENESLASGEVPNDETLDDDISEEVLDEVLVSEETGAEEIEEIESVTSMGVGGYIKLPAISYYRIQIIALTEREDAEAIRDDLRAEGYYADIVGKGGLYSIQAGTYGQRTIAESYMEELQELGYEDCWVTTWQLDAILEAENGLRLAQASAVQELAEAVTLALNDEPAFEPAINLPIASSATEEQQWQIALSSLRVWINDPSSRNSAQRIKLVENLRDIYAWFS